MTRTATARRRAINQTLLFLILCVVTFVTLVPLIWAGMTSVKQPAEAFAIPPVFFFEPTFEYHIRVWTEYDFPRYLMNSLIVSAGTILISVPIATLAAYGLSRMPSGRATGILLGLFCIRMFPHILLAIPFFVMGSWLSLIDSYPLLIAAFVAINQPFTIWLMYGFFQDIPKELDEAAALDGCNSWHIFAFVVLPLVRPGVAVAALFSLLLSYNEFLFALILTGSSTRTLPVGIASFGGEDVTDWSLSAAAAIGIMAPVIIVMVLLQRQFLRGMTMGAIK